MRKKEDITVELISESDNPRDANAIYIKAKICGAIHELGYVGLAKIPKVRMTLRNKDIEKVTSWYVKNLHERKLRGYIHLCKRGKWLADSPSNVYNSDL